jgi:polar amino acid transport system substrate-binding protein
MAAAPAGAVSAAGANRKIAAEVPGAVKRAGILTVATNGQPDSDLARALAGLMGLRVRFDRPSFVEVLPGVAAHKYDLGMFSVTDTKARERSVDFVTYFEAGISLYVRATGTPAVTSLADLCGREVGVPVGTVEEQTAAMQGSKCLAAGRPAVAVVAFPNEAAATAALLRGSVQVAMADTPIATGYVNRARGQLRLSGRPFDIQPWGIAVAKRSGLTKPVLDGISLLIADGQYMAILKRWGQQSGAIKRATVNGAIG